MRSNNFDPMKRISEIESRGNRKAVSNRGAIGLMQITQPVIDDWNRSNPRTPFALRDAFDENINKMLGAWYWQVQIPKLLSGIGYKDSEINRAAAYNWGVGNIKKSKWDGREETLPEETRNWYKKFKS